MNLPTPSAFPLPLFPPLLAEAGMLPDSVNMLDPQSPHTQAIYHLGMVSLVVFRLIFATVGGAIVYGIAHFRAREGEPDPKQVAGNKTVEIV